MYSPSIINSNLSRIQRSLPFKLTYHSVSEVDSFNIFSSTFINQQKWIDRNEIEWIKPKTKEFIEWVKNERILCQLDFNYWATRYYWISDFRNKFIHFSPNLAQQIQLDVISNIQDLEQAIRILLLKARQRGGTTLWQGLITHRVQFYSDVNSMIASADKTRTRKMSSMSIEAYRHQPFWLVPQRLNYSEGDFFKYTNGSLLDLSWGTGKGGLGRGTTPTASHLSECSIYPNPEEDIEASLIRAMHETIWLLQCFESTANGRDDWWHKLWKRTCEGYESGIESLYPIFIGWWCGSEIDITREWLSARSVAFEKYIPTDRVKKHAIMCENYIKNDKLWRKYLGSNWQMSREMMFYYDLEYDRHRKLRILPIFFQEMPATPEQAFQNSISNSILDAELISEIEQEAMQREPIGVYKFKGNEEEIPLSVQLTSSDTIDDSKRTISIDTSVINSDSNVINPSNIELVPILYDGFNDKFNRSNKVIIWELPNHQLNNEYNLSLDFSEGLGEDVSDDSGIEIWKNGTVESKDEQVLEFASPDLSAGEMDIITLALATLYSKVEVDKSNFNYGYKTLKQLKISPEAGKGGGDELVNNLVKRGWSNFFQHYDMTKETPTYNNRLGFYSNVRTRDAIIKHFLYLLKGGWIKINSPFLVSQIKNLQKLKTGKIAGVGIAVDDLVIISAISLYSLHQDEIIGFKKKAWIERVRDEVGRRESFNSFELREKFDESKMNEREKLSYLYDFERSDINMIGMNKSRQIEGMVESFIDRENRENGNDGIRVMELDGNIRIEDVIDEMRGRFYNNENDELLDNASDFGW